MSERPVAVFDSSFASVARAFAGELISFARPRLFGTARLVLLGAVLEGFGLLLIVPLLALVTGTSSGAFAAGIDAAFARGGESLTLCDRVLRFDGGRCAVQ